MVCRVECQLFHLLAIWLQFIKCSKPWFPHLSQKGWYLFYKIALPGELLAHAWYRASIPYMSTIL